MFDIFRHAKILCAAIESQVELRESIKLESREYAVYFYWLLD